MVVQRIEEHEASRARRFLLGRLSEEEAAEFETQLLAGGELMDTVKAVEDELRDELARGTLSSEERETLAPRFDEQPDRMRLAQAFADHRKRGTHHRGTVVWWAAAAAILVLIGAGVIRRIATTHPDVAVPQTASHAPEPDRPVAAPHKVVTFMVVLAATRDDEAPARLAIAADVTEVALTIRLHPADRYPAYEVTLRRDGTPIWNGRVTKRSGSEIVVPMAASLLSPGDYAVAVDGIQPNAQREELGEQTFIVASAPRSRSR